jgi:hypothetical protein
MGSHGGSGGRCRDRKGWVASLCLASSLEKPWADPAFWTDDFSLVLAPILLHSAMLQTRSALDEVFVLPGCAGQWMSRPSRSRTPITGRRGALSKNEDLVTARLSKKRGIQSRHAIRVQINSRLRLRCSVMWRRGMFGLTPRVMRNLLFPSSGTPTTRKWLYICPPNS